MYLFNVSVHLFIYISSARPDRRTTMETIGRRLLSCLLPSRGGSRLAGGLRPGFRLLGFPFGV